MTTTNAWLQAQGAAGEMAMSLVFDGLDLVYTTTADTSGIATAFAPTSQWATVKGGLYVSGQVSQEIQAFAPRITTQSMQFTILDVDGTLRPRMLGNLSTVASTFVKNDIDPTDTTFNVLSSTEFDASGTGYIGHETFAYSSKTGAPDHTLVTSQRGKYSLFGASGSDYFKRRHAGTLRRTEAPGRTVTPEIRNATDTFYNRQVALILHHKETTATTSLWSTVDLPLTNADSKVLWVGRIKEWSDNGDGSITLSCISSHELLTGHVFSQQFRGTLAPGGYITSVDNGLKVSWYEAASAYSYDLNDGQLLITSGWQDKFYTYGELIHAINEQLNDWADDGSFPTNGGNPNHRIQFAVKQGDEGLRVHVECESIASLVTQNEIRIQLSPRVWSILGFSTGKDLTIVSRTQEFESRYLKRDNGSTTLFRLVADGPPLWYQSPDTFVMGDKVVVFGETGSWIDQPTVPAEIDGDNSATGFLQIGDRLFGAYKNTATLGGTETTTFTLTFPMSEPVVSSAARNLDASAEPPSVRQVWCERGQAGKLLLQLMLSTGEAAYNEATYDVYGAGMGLGIPYYQIDVGSFESLDTPFEFLADKPTPFREILEEILTVYNRHVVIDNGQIALTRPGFDSTATEDIITLDETTKAEEPGAPGITPVSYGTAGIINHVVLSYTSLRVLLQNKWMAGPGIERSELFFQVEDQTSISRFSSRRTLEIKARGITDAAAVAEYIVKPILRYFAEPSGIIRRTINHRMFHLLPGDAVALTDNYVTDPATLTRGISGMPCWVKSIDCDYATGRGEIELYFLPGHPARYGKLAPSALMTSYDAGTKTATFSAHAFSRTTDSVDVANFTAGDEVQFVEMSPATVGSPSVLTDVIATVNSGANTATLVTGVSPTGGLAYVMEPREVASASVPTTTQRNAYAFLADDSDKLINAAYSAKTWGGPSKSLDARTSGYVYDQQFVRPATKDSTADEPVSSRKLMNLVNNCNVLLNAHTRNAISWVFSISATSTSYRLALYPVWVPLYGINPDDEFSRTLVGKVLVERNAGTTSVKVVSCPSMVIGTSASSYSYPGYTFSAEVTRSSAGQAWEDFELVPAITTHEGMLGTWITVEVKNSSGSTFGGVRGLSICETKIG
jgi:hypothetical protein